MIRLPRAFIFTVEQAFNNNNNISSSKIVIKINK